MFDIVITGGSLVFPGWGVRRADLAVKGEYIAAILDPTAQVEAARVIDASGLHVFPGAIDPHVHVGLAEATDEYGVETRAAAMGGVTTVCCFLLTAESYQEAFARHLEEASNRSLVDFTYHFILMNDTHLEELDSYVQELGLGSHKYFMNFRGNEGSYIGVTGTDDGYLYTLLEKIAVLPGGLAMIHAESIEVVWKLRDAVRASGRADLKAWNDTRPPVTEAEAIARVAFYAAEVNCPLYIVHVSSQAGVNAVRTLRRHFPSLPLYAETCPHYLTHTYDTPIGDVGKVNPPLRSERDVEALWEALADGTLNTVGSDHVGRRLSSKQGGVWKASAGFPNLPITLPVLLSEGFHRRGLPLDRIAELTAFNPARIFNMHRQKGDLAVGLHADLALVDLNHSRKATPEYVRTWADYSIYQDWELRGWPMTTLVRGQVVAAHGDIVGQPGWGRFVDRRPMPVIQST